MDEKRITRSKAQFMNKNETLKSEKNTRNKSLSLSSQSSVGSQSSLTSQGSVTNNSDSSDVETDNSSNIDSDLDNTNLKLKISKKKKKKKKLLSFNEQIDEENDVFDNCDSCDYYDEYDSNNYNTDSDTDYVPNFLDETDESIESEESISSEEIEEIKSNTDKGLINKHKKGEGKLMRKLRIQSNKELEYDLSNKNDIVYFNKLSPEDKTIIIEMEDHIKKINQNKIPLRFKILESKIPIEIKASAISKLESLNNLDDSSNEYNKIKTYIDGLIKIPFGNYIELPITKGNTEIEIKDFLVNSKNILEKAVYGHLEAKCHILQLLSQWISNPESTCNSLAIYGDMGIGKTTLIKHGLSKVLDRPYEFISLGGSNDSSFLDGHSYTYEGAQCGKIIQILQEKKCMNPIIYFDELDKISDTPKGEEIINLLIHLTDDSQNSHFQDKYYTGIDIDLSRVLFVFSFNNPEKINPILKDRIHSIKLTGFKLEEKIIIAKQYLIKSILNQFNIQESEIIFNEDIIEYIITKYTKENGVRELRKKLHTIISRINLIKLSLSSRDLDLPFDSDKIDITKKIILNIELVDNLLTSNEINNQENISKLMMYM